MVSSKCKVETEHRRNLYFNKYSYRASIVIADIQRLRYYKSYSEYINHVRSWSWDINPNAPLSNKDEIDRYFDYVDNHAGDTKVRIEYGKVIVYANSEAELRLAIARIKPVGEVHLYSIVIPSDAETIEFAKEPKYKFRNYFRAKNVTAETKDMMLKFIKAQQDNGTEVEFNDAMIKQLKRKSYRKDGIDYLYAHYFVDYNDESLQALFALMFGEYMNPKIFRLVKRSK